jgi:hypothetical protein
MNIMRNIAISVFIWLIFGVEAPALLQAEPTLRIISPADGTVVQPGETVTFKVEASGNFTTVIVGAETPIKWSEVRTSPPYEFMIQIPTRISLRGYDFTAGGAATSGQMIYSKPITLNIERKERPVSTRVQPRTLRLAVGETGYLFVIGTYPDGSTSTITESTSTEYVSKSPDIATVKRDGRVTAVAPGTTQIVINADCIVQVTVVNARN